MLADAMAVARQPRRAISVNRVGACIITAILVGATSALVYVSSAVIAALAVFGITAAIVLGVLSERALLVLIVGSLYLNSIRWAVPGGAFGIRLSFLVVAVALPFEIYRWLGDRQGLIRVPGLGFLIGLVAAFTVATVANTGSIYRTSGLADCVLLLLNVSILALVFRAARTSSKNRQAIVASLVLFAVIYSLFGIFVIVLANAGVEWIKPLANLRPAGEVTLSGTPQLIARPVFLDTVMSSYLGAVGVLAFALSLLGRARIRAAYGIASVLIFTAVALSFARGSWVAAIVGVVAALALLIIAKRGRLREISWSQLAANVALLGLALGTLSLLQPALRVGVWGRAQNVVNSGTGTGAQRLEFWRAITTDALHSPVLGHGVDAYKILLPPQCGQCAGEYVAENAVIEVIHAGGVVGLALYLLPLGVTALLVLQYLRKPPGDDLLGIAAVASFVAVFVGSQTNPAWWGNMYWLIWGLCLACLAPRLRADPLLHRKRHPRTLSLYESSRRAFDVVFSLGILVAGIPVWALIAVMIKLTSPGPVLYKAIVVGKGGEQFTYFKFRSMRAGDDTHHREWLEAFVKRDEPYRTENGTTIYKAIDDPRVTPVGRFLRRTSLDELPQLINVLRGEMSVVGPRPPLPLEYVHYDQVARARLAVRPGITGLCQVTARGRIPFSGMLELDMRYIASRSWRLDLAIMFATAAAVSGGAGAA